MGKEEEEYNAYDVVVQAEAVPLTAELQHEIDPLKSGFFWYVPPQHNEESTHGHEWRISGHDMQVFTTSVPPGDTIVTEVGSFMFMSPFMKTEVEFTLCGENGCSVGCGRICGGESCVKVLLKNESSEEGYAGITPNFPAKVVPITFGTHVKSGSHLIATPGAYMTELGDIDVGCDLDCSPTTCCFAGLGCCRQKISGSDGSIALLAAGGTLVYRQLKEGETVIVDTRSIVCFENTVQLGISFNGGLCTCCCGGEGPFSTTLTGPGKVFLQSMGFAKFKQTIQSQVVDDRGSKASAAGDAAGLVAALA